MLTPPKILAIRRFFATNRAFQYYVSEGDIIRLIEIINYDLMNWKCPICRELSGPMTYAEALRHPGAFMFYEKEA